MGCRTSFVAALVIGMDDSCQMYKKSKTGRLMKVLKNGYKFFLILMDSMKYIYQTYSTFEKLKFWNLFMS